MSKRRRSWIVIGCSGCLLLAAVLLLARAAGPAGTRHQAIDGEPAGERSEVSTMVAMPSPPASATKAFRDRTEGALAAYREFAQYPPWSRPATESNRSSTAWNGGASSEPQWLTGDDGTTYGAALALDQMFASRGETITATVLVWRGQSVTDRVAYDAVAEVQVWDAERRTQHAHDPDRRDRGWFSIADVPLNRDGRAEVTPSNIPALADSVVADTRLLATVTVAGKTTRIAVPFRYEAQPVLTVIGKERQVIKDGSLEVTLDVEVHEPASTEIVATLFAHNEPIAVYRRYHRLDRAGRHSIPLVFFGRAIRERGLSGPYRVQAIHGRAKTASGVDRFWKHDNTFAIGQYDLSEFSSDEWSSPEKDAKIAQYEGALERLGATTE